MKRFFLFCSGADLQVLARCPTDESKYAGIGATIVLTAMMAAFSGGYALYTVVRSVAAGVAFGLLWGAVIFSLDRAIVSRIRKQKHFYQDLAFALPRMGLAVLLAMVISRPLEMRLYERELTAQVARMNDDAFNDAVERVNGRFGRIDVLARDNERLARQIEASRRAVEARYGEWTAGRDGAAAPDTPGMVSAEQKQRLDDARRRLEAVKRRNEPVIARNAREIDRLRAQRNQQLARIDRAPPDADGLLVRLRALRQLEARDDEVRRASWFITLVFVALEIAPVTVKLLSMLNPYRPYDELLEEHAARLGGSSP